MENKLQELTRKLYDEGLEKGRADADKLVADAKAEAARLVAEAKAEAEAIINAAETKAEDLRKNSMAEISLAGKQAVAKLKEQVAEMIIAKSTVEGVKAANLDAEFVKKMLVEVAHNWNGASSENVSLEALLPEAKKAELGEAIEASAKALLAEGIEVGFSADVKSGFKVGEKGGGYYISFSDESVEALLGGYLREKVAQLLFKA
jgi:V/A-type H+-transporting ATPase subunit E